MPSHICLISNRHWIYDGRVINQARALAAAGYRVTVADMGRPADWYRAARAETVNPAEFLPAGATVKRIEDLGAELPMVARNFIRKQLRWFLAAGRTRQLAAIRADVYQAPDLVNARYAARAAHSVGARFVYDIRDLYSAEWEGADLSRRRRRGIAQEADLVRRADACLTVSPGLARMIEERYPARRAHVIRSCRDPVPVDEDGRDVRRALGLDMHTPLLVHTGHSVREKGVTQQVHLVRALPDVHLAMVGQQLGLDDVEDAATRTQVRARVHVLPTVPAPEVPAFIRTADAAVIYMPPESANARYALPNKFFEAVAAGLPLAISDGEEFRPLVEQFGMGVVFDPADPRSALDAVTSVLHDGQRYRDAMRVAREHLSWRRESVAYVQVYTDLRAP